VTDTRPALLALEIGPPGVPPGRSPRVVAIVSAARRLLEREGTAALSMRRLASELGMKAPSLYKHFESKSAVESALIQDAMFEIGAVGHAAIHAESADPPLTRLVLAYREHALAHPNLYRLATDRSFPRQDLIAGLEDWARNPFYVVTGEEHLAQALWSLAHGMVILELDGRYPPGSDLDRTWRIGASAFEAAARTSGN
jgi:AcrR family transcriptional regulator